MRSSLSLPIRGAMSRVTATPSRKTITVGWYCSDPGYFGAMNVSEGLTPGTPGTPRPRLRPCARRSHPELLPAATTQIPWHVQLVGIDDQEGGCRNVGVVISGTARAEARDGDGAGSDSRGVGSHSIVELDPLGGAICPRVVVAFDTRVTPGIVDQEVHAAPPGITRIGGVLQRQQVLLAPSRSDPPIGFPSRERMRIRRRKAIRRTEDWLLEGSFYRALRSSRWRKQLTTWSFTSPHACMNA
jgi:hypothetical protein